MADMVDTLKDLHTSVVDAVHGYDEAVKNAKNAEAIAQFRKLQMLHTNAHQEIDPILRSMGVVPDEAGSYMSTVHRTVIGIRAMVTGLEENSFPSFVSGEKMLLQKYDETLAQPGLKQSDEKVIAAQRAKLAAAVADMENASTA